MKLSDETIAHIVKLLQIAIMTGTDITDNFRTLMLVEDNGVLNIDEEYLNTFHENLDRIVAEGEKNNSESSEEQSIF
tara:strand:- start:226 stop:456 length:231 start_codon:yes stop_codon:yes gene_type:complete